MVPDRTYAVPVHGGFSDWSTECGASLHGSKTKIRSGSIVKKIATKIVT